MVDPASAPVRLDRCAHDYLAGTPADHPLVCPLLADLTGLPPLLVQAASDDALVTDAQRLVERATQQRLTVTFDLQAIEAHDFHVFWSFLPEAADAVQRAGRFAARSTLPAFRRPPPVSA